MGKKPVVLMILDGFGQKEEEYGNAIKAANTKNLDEIFNKFPTTSLDASQMAVGLPDGQIGNSEVGHTNIGAGRIVYQNLARINKALEDGSFFSNEAFLNAAKNCKINGSAMHIMGLLSDGGVHSHIKHLYGLLKFCRLNELKNVYIHIFTDGRDVSPTSSLKFVKNLQQEIKNIGVGEIATISGRYYAMDRDNRWDRVKKAYDAIVCGEGDFCEDPAKVLEKSYEENVTDEFIKPTV